ncbi:sodium-coupled monocarboxylate transporter 2-like [Penaeus chinensis]|uniref:sodium-coupled monocarboxylate transporter 2-like n=1 Tax=Penaeus chinensis TaxID=139456 RepID=UPI001FB73431|nr:sodium-coupled monocarboxylate transporter 2-like [Penaeus chinensis]
MGLLVIAMAFFAKNFGGLFQTTMTLAGVAAGPTLGLYLTGVLVPYCDRRGAFAGLVVSATCLAWITLGASIYGSKPELLPFSNETCPGFYRDHGTNNSLFKPAFTDEAPNMEVGFMEHEREAQARESATAANAPLSEDDNWGLMYLYGLSYTLFMALGMVVFVAAASLVTLITGGEDLRQVRPEFVSPLVRGLLPAPPRGPRNTSCHPARTSTPSEDAAPVPAPAFAFAPASAPALSTIRVLNTKV